MIFLLEAHLKLIAGFGNFYKKKQAPEISGEPAFVLIPIPNMFYLPKNLFTASTRLVTCNFS